jgi:hypothetical protein
MLYGMGKYVFMVANESWQPPGTKPADRPLPLARVESAPRAWVRWAGHADVRWHLWIILAALGRLDVALVAYAVYFPARTLAGAFRKAARHG